MYTEATIRNIMARVYKQFSKRFEIFGVFLKGSQNYGTSTEDSDVDLVVVTIPSFHDLAGEKIRGFYLDSFEKNFDEEFGQITVRSIEDFFKEFLKPNIANHEFLFTNYTLLNDKYAGYWLGGIMKYRKELVNLHVSNLIRSCVGNGMNALVSAFPQGGKEEYSPKRLVFAMCCLDYIENILAGKENPFVFDSVEEMIELKEHPLNYESALSVKESIEEELNFFNKTKGDIAYNPASSEEYAFCQNVICSTLENILRDSLSRQLISTNR